MTTSTSPTVSSHSPSSGASGSSLPPFRSFLRMLNWRRDPAVEMQIERSKQRTKQLESEIEQLRRIAAKRDNALLDWMHSEIDLIEADLPSTRPHRHNRRTLQRLLSLINSPEMAGLYRLPLS